jgi:hypothetical protein
MLCPCTRQTLPFLTVNLQIGQPRRCIKVLYPGSGRISSSARCLHRIPHDGLSSMSDPALMPIERALVQARNTTGSKTSTTSVIQRRHGKVLLSDNRPSLRHCKRGMRLAVKAKAGTVFRLSEVVTVQSMVASHNFVRSQVCCGGGHGSALRRA